MTRMWMVHPKILCKNHLLGEHKEIHQLVGSIKRKYSVKGYIEKNCIEIKSIVQRHIELVNEMQSRGYNHKSPITEKLDYSYLPDNHINYTIDVESSLVDLINRCPLCREMYLHHRYL